MNDNFINPNAFHIAYRHFQKLLTEKDGRSFENFGEGLVAEWENYKTPLRDHALGLLRVGEWTEEDIGSGEILRCTMEAIEIEGGEDVPRNNLVQWHGGYGSASREHHAFAEAVADPGSDQCRRIEAALFRLYRTDKNENLRFSSLAAAANNKYPLLSYLFFLKDMDRFAPVKPTYVDRVFEELDIDFATSGNCNWHNYSQYNRILDEMRPMIEETAGIENVRLIDAHSFCWVFSELLK